MSTTVIFILFGLTMAAANYFKISMIVPLLVGLILFVIKSVTLGFKIKQIIKMTFPGVKNSFVVIRILLMIGCLTGLWRSCGTIPFFVVKGIDLLPEKEFILASFLLSSFISYALGTSFGVTATCGTILMAIARAGNANTILTAGAILSGVYVGDRGSPSSSSANLIAITTKTDIRENLKIMLRFSIIPYFACVLIYYVLSLNNPMSISNSEVLDSISNAFNLHWTCIIPAVIMIVLPFCKVKIIICMCASALASLIISIFVQGQPVGEVFLTVLRGFKPADKLMASVLSGGGITSMLEVCGILIVSGTYEGIFKSTKMLQGVNNAIFKLKSKIGRFPVMIILAITICAVFCNQTIGVIMQSQLSANLYDDSTKDKRQKMIDMEDSIITLAGMVPWCIAASVPLKMMGASFNSLPFAFYLYLVPLSHFITSKILTKARLYSGN